jgi:hypothetical protein
MNILDQRPDLIVKNINIGFADESRVPEMNDAIDSLVRVLDNQPNEK